MSDNPAATVLDVTPAQYLRGEGSDGPCLSSSIAHTLVARSPAHAYIEHPLLGGKPQPPTAAQDEGSILHAMLLLPVEDWPICVIKEDSFRTNCAKDMRDLARSAGKIPILEHKYAAIEVAAEQIARNMRRFGLDFANDGGHSELPIEFWSDGVKCRAMLDHAADAKLYDLKKVKSADPRTIQRHIYEYGLDIQWAAYTRAYEALRPELAGRLTFTFVFCEIEPPYCVVPYELDGQFQEIGKQRWGRARDIWRRCLEDDAWPGYAQQTMLAEPAPWMMMAEGMI